jgi:predicted RND superfamily exporter protein
MLDYVSREGPYATLGAFVAVLIVIVISFRRARHFLILSASMLIGVVLMMGVAVALDQKINFLNFIAIPIQFGIGVDYSVNIYARYLQEGPGSIGRIIRSTGGAVLITSTTTIIGYGSMWFSINGAINSMANLANIGEVTCLFTATLLMPAFVVVFCKGLERQSA